MEAKSRPMMRPASVTEPAGTMVCPGCGDVAFTCDACLHQHLMAAHDVRYSDVYGHNLDDWVHLCATHDASLATIMGL